jgi:hypothetical protein
VNAAAARAREEHRLAEQAVPSAPSALVADPGDLVTRALAILAEETETWQTRRHAYPSLRNSR